MRRSNTQSISDVLKESLKAMQLDTKLKEVRLINSWEDVLGKTVAKATTDIYIRKRVLFVSLSSSVVRKELSMIKEGIIKRLNEIAGEELVTDIVLR